MSNGNLIICDPEEGYAQALAYYLMHKKEFGMEVQVYDRIEKVQEIADRTKIQILFVAAEYEAEERKKVPAEQKFLLTGAGNSQVLKDETALYKYQSGEKIVKLLLEVGKNLNCPVMTITHNAEMARVADRVFHMKDGRLERITVNEHPCRAEELDW